MNQFNSVSEVLDFAINREQEAADFYFYLAKQMTRSEMREHFEDFAKQELGHKNRLVLLKSKKKPFHMER